MLWKAPLSAVDAGSVKAHDSEEPIMQVITTIGLDIASQSFKFTALMLAAKWSFNGRLNPVTTADSVRDLPLSGERRSL